MIELKVGTEADQQFSVILDGRRVTIRLRFNRSSDHWSFDLSIDDSPVLHGRKIVTNVDLLEPFDFGIGVLFAASVTGAEPGRNELPNGQVKLFHTTRAEIDAAISS